MALNFLDELDITSTGDTVLQGFDKCQDNFEWLDDLFHGYARRSKFRWKDADEIYIGSGVYHHEGTVNQLVYWASELTFKLGSAGSNAGSDDLTASAWHYIYIDDTAVVTAGTKLLTETEFRNETTAPTWSASKHGWYSGDDRCIFAVLTSGASEVLEFYHSGDYFEFTASISEVAAGTPSTTPTSETLTLPGFCTRAKINTRHTWSNSNTTVLTIRPDGATAAGKAVSQSGNDVTHPTWVSLDVITDTSQGIDYYLSSASTNPILIHLFGWYFPEGM